MLRSGLAAFALLALAGRASAEIRYAVAYDEARDRLNVSVTFPARGATTLRMPSWSPGLYVREDYWKTLDDVTATDEHGAALSVGHPQGDTWTIQGKGTIVVRYSRPVDRANARLGMFASSGGAIHYTGPSTYLYVEGRKTEPCSIAFPKGVNVALGLPSRNGVYVAKGYDDLADATVTLGEFLVSTYETQGKGHTVAFRGPKAADLDREKVARFARFVSEAVSSFFGEAPYLKYVWHVMVGPSGDNAGGVEHLNGTDIFVGDRPGPGALHGMAHEYFHLYNVKRIRSRELGPFDYTRLPSSGALWWLEGVTDYYASILPYRAGAWDETTLLQQAANAIRAVRSNAARLEVSPFEAGERIPESVNGGSNGYRVNYYPTGWTLGFMLDLELRARTDGKRSLDDVELALWRLCKDGKPGFERGEIRRQLVRFGGAEMGGLYDAWVLRPGELPLEATLAKFGLELQEGRIARRPDASPAQHRLLEGWLRQHPLPSPY